MNFILILIYLELNISVVKMISKMSLKNVLISLYKDLHCIFFEKDDSIMRKTFWKKTFSETIEKYNLQ